MSIKTTHPLEHDGLSYFESLPRRELDHSSSTHVSPGSQPTHSIRHRSRHIEPSLHIRSRSDQPVHQRKINVIPVTEKASTVKHQSAPASITSPKASVTSLSRNISTVTRSTHTPNSVQEVTSAFNVSRLSVSWNRTPSGGVRNARPRSGNRREAQQSLDRPSSTSRFFRSERDIAPPLPKPMRPPLTRSDDSSRSAYHHEVKLETSFTASIELPPVPQPLPKRRLSLHPRQVFSSTILLARRLSLRRKLSKTEKDISGLPAEGSYSNLSPILNLSHSTALRPNKTASVLQSVTSILSKTEGEKSSRNSALPKLVSNVSDFSTRSTSNGVPRPPISFLTSGGTTARTPAVSYTSSQRELRLGAVPTGTPEDNATYRVGNQVYFKVDISVRGGTSYLPSEARRIHTPPLPGEDVHVQGPLGPNGHRYVKMKPRTGGDNELPATRPPNMSRALTRDWYDVQLALLESEARPALDHDLPVDYDIPEHLPSSPLCPRNERYWRYVQGKLKRGEDRHRVCWMHGIVTIGEM